MFNSAEYVTASKTVTCKQICDEGYSRNALCAVNLISTFYYYHWVDTSAGGLLVPEGIIRPVVSASALTWFNRYTFVCVIEIYFLNS